MENRYVQIGSAIDHDGPNIYIKADAIITPTD